MYGNNFYRPFIMPNTPYITNPISNIRQFNTLTNTFGKNNIFTGIKKINWSNMLNNTSKTLGIIKEAIPVVREVKPMMNNMKSMLKIASVFKDETDANTNNNKNIVKEEITNTNYTSNNNPNFFI